MLNTLGLRGASVPRWLPANGEKLGSLKADAEKKFVLDGKEERAAERWGGGVFPGSNAEPAFSALLLCLAAGWRASACTRAGRLPRGRTLTRALPGASDLTRALPGDLERAGLRLRATRDSQGRPTRTTRGAPPGDPCSTRVERREEPLSTRGFSTNGDL